MWADLSPFLTVTSAMVTSRKRHVDEADPDTETIDRRINEKGEPHPQDWEELGLMLNRHWHELESNGGRWMGAYFDLFRLRTYRVAAYAIPAALLGTICVAVSIIAVVYGTRGAAELLERLYGGRRWAGDLTIAFVWLAGLFIAGRILVQRVLAALDRDLRERYEIRRRQMEKVSLKDAHRHTEAGTK